MKLTKSMVAGMALASAVLWFVLTPIFAESESGGFSYVGGTGDSESGGPQFGAGGSQSQGVLWGTGNQSAWTPINQGSQSGGVAAQMGIGTENPGMPKQAGSLSSSEMSSSPAFGYLPGGGVANRGGQSESGGVLWGSSGAWHE